MYAMEYNINLKDNFFRGKLVKMEELLSPEWASLDNAGYSWVPLGSSTLYGPDNCLHDTVQETCRQLSDVRSFHVHLPFMFSTSATPLFPCPRNSVYSSTL